jgi:mersacidin/lichenicidin family type 2 lantibiotic
MSNKNIIRAWKDEDYRLSLSEAERALLPEHPAGLIELSGAEMDGVGGGHDKYRSPVHDATNAFASAQSATCNTRPCTWPAGCGDHRD